MRVPEIMKRKMCFSFEVFPPKADKPLEPLLETLERLYLFNPDFISCTYGAGGTNAGRNVEIYRAIKQSKKTIIPASATAGRKSGRKCRIILPLA